mmetsp:Transcript_42112/g.103844  ORF Transcript_42112/g.103844 Transcript_42112/m.103844 type:complete len:215 (-) Transcript_42112:450-1094(-)
MDCPARAPFDSWDPILQRFVGPFPGASPGSDSGSESRAELLAKQRALSPPANMAALRVSGTPDMHTPACEGGIAAAASASVAWWRTGAQGGSGGSGGSGGGSDPRARACTSGVSPPAAMRDLDNAEEASRQLAMQLHEEEQAAFLHNYEANLLVSPGNPTRRSGQSVDPYTPAVGMDMETDESLQLAWQLQAEELQYSAFRRARAPTGEDMSPP